VATSKGYCELCPSVRPFHDDAGCGYLGAEALCPKANRLVAVHSRQVPRWCPMVTGWSGLPDAFFDACSAGDPVAAYRALLTGGKRCPD
jgi:hypothetical protein